MKPPEDLDALWARHHAEWRDPAQIASQWEDAQRVDPLLMRYKVQGVWWELLEEHQITLLVTREYEHLVMALGVQDGKPQITYMKLPHPSGMVADLERGLVYVASTRNPNQIFDLAPASGVLPRLDAKIDDLSGNPLLPIRSRYYPGCFYMHDLALVGGQLFANSVGQNAVVRLAEDGRVERVWYPRCIETPRGAVFGQNHIQLNSIAAGASLAQSYFSASSDRISALRPGHKNYPVDKRGVIFSGMTREPIVRGLTRPHSARLYRSELWVDNSGYGQLVKIEGEAIVPVVTLPGWTRGLGFHGHIAFVGTSRVIPRFRQYAPGLSPESSQCGVHAVDTRTGAVLGSLIWPRGNQIFAVEPLPRQFTLGFPFVIGRRHSADRQKRLFYAFTTKFTWEETR